MSSFPRPASVLVLLAMSMPHAACGDDDGATPDGSKPSNPGRSDSGSPGASGAGASGAGGGGVHSHDGGVHGDSGGAGASGADAASGSGGRAGGPGGGAGKDAAAGSSAQLRADCPTSLPAMDAACDPLGLVCQYGDDPRTDCRPYATCSNTWSVVDPTDQPSCAALPAPAVACPKDLAAADGQACDYAQLSPSNPYCSYDATICVCTMAGFHCGQQLADSRCPPSPPNWGTSCATDALSCTYRCGVQHVCDSGYWTRHKDPFAMCGSQH